MSDIEEPKTQKALRECAEWLSYCLRIGWKKGDLDKLEEIWWTRYDNYGRLKQP